MTIDGKEYLPDHRGRYYCPNKCGNPDWPAPHWSTEKGFAGHMAKCKGKPDNLEGWTPPPEPDKTVWGICPDCGKDIYEMESCWPMSDRTICVSNGCWEKYCEQGIGFHDCAGLKFPEITLSQ
jgi:hypothetical protein